MQSAFLRNTPWAAGVVVYAGPETKLSLNQKLPPSKFSALDKRLNKVVILIFSVYSCICLLLAILGGIYEVCYLSVYGACSIDFSFFFLHYEWFQGSVVGDTYVDTDPKSSSGLIWGIKLFFSYFVLLSFLIPLVSPICSFLFYSFLFPYPLLLSLFLSLHPWPCWLREESCCVLGNREGYTGQVHGMGSWYGFGSC